jgi:hypothetical protein
MMMIHLPRSSMLLLQLLLLLLLLSIQLRDERPAARLTIFHQC